MVLGMKGETEQVDYDAGALSGGAVSPSHITGFFQIFENGCTGAGVNTEHGARTRVRILDTSARTTVVLNGELSAAPVSNRVVQSFECHLRGRGVRVEHQISSPIGYGLGMSGSGAFSLALALNDALSSPLSYAECMELSVRAEIASGTGLGDVVAQQFEGVMFGLPPYPSRSVEVIPSTGLEVVCAFFAPLDTKSIIRDSGWKARINAVGSECMQELMKNKTLSKFTALCRHFTFETGLASDELRRVLTAIPEASMAMLGQTAFVLTADAPLARAKLSKFTNRIQTAKPAAQGAHVLEE